MKKGIMTTLKEHIKETKNNTRHLYLVDILNNHVIYFANGEYACELRNILMNDLGYYGLKDYWKKNLNWDMQDNWNEKLNSPIQKHSTKLRYKIMSKILSYTSYTPLFYVIDTKDNYILFKGSLKKCEEIINNGYGHLSIITKKNLTNDMKARWIPENLNTYFKLYHKKTPWIIEASTSTDICSCGLSHSVGYTPELCYKIRYGNRNFDGSIAPKGVHPFNLLSEYY